MSQKIVRMLLVLLLATLVFAACGQETGTGTTTESPAAEGEAAESPAAEGEAAESPAAEGDATESPAAEADTTETPAAGADTTETPAAEATGPVELADGRVVLAVLNDQSGIYADLSGPRSVEAVNMAVEDFQEKYGEDALGGSIEVISADHQNKPDLANARAQEMYERNGADVILDVPNSAAGLAVAGQAQSNKKLFLAIGPATTALTGENCNKYTFHYAYDTYMLAQGTGATVTNEVGKNWYIMYPDYAFGQDMNENFTNAIEANEGQVVHSDPTPFPSDDFSTYLLKAPTLSPKPEILGTMHAGGEMINVVKQFNEFGLRDQGINLAVGLMFLTDIHALGADAFAGTLYTDAWYWNMDDEARAWADRFNERTGVRPTFAHAANYSAAMQYLEAIRRAGTDESDAVVEALEGYEFNDFFARNAQVRPEDHRVIHDAYLARVKPAAEVEEDWDYVEIVRTIPAEEAFMPLDQSQCNMPTE
jgi:branched-chain amino acid transport system substrate-binding protein